MPPATTPVELSVVIPVYGCSRSLRELHRRLVASIEPLTDDFEIVLVDDASPDGAWPVLCELAEADHRVRVLRLSRNFGQHAAITAGLTRSRGHWTVVMDCDLEEPPEEIPRLYAAAQEGYDIVRGERTGRRHTAFRRWASKAYRYLFLEGDRHAGYGTLSIISRPVVEAFLSLRDRDREYQLVLDWLGFRQTTIRFQHGLREEGKSAYDLRGLVKVAFDGMFFRTTVLLRLIVLAASPLPRSASSWPPTRSMPATPRARRRATRASPCCCCCWAASSSSASASSGSTWAASSSRSRAARCSWSPSRSSRPRARGRRARAGRWNRSLSAGPTTSRSSTGGIAAAGR